LAAFAQLAVIQYFFNLALVCFYETVRYLDNLNGFNSPIYQDEVVKVV